MNIPNANDIVRQNRVRKNILHRVKYYPVDIVDYSKVEAGNLPPFEGITNSIDVDALTWYISSLGEIISPVVVPSRISDAVRIANTSVSVFDRVGNYIPPAYEGSRNADQVKLTKGMRIVEVTFAKTAEHVMFVRLFKFTGDDKKPFDLEANIYAVSDYRVTYENLMSKLEWREILFAIIDGFVKNNGLKMPYGKLMYDMLDSMIDGVVPDIIVDNSKNKNSVRKTKR